MRPDSLPSLLEEIPIKLLRPSSRSLRSEASDTDELASSISEKGLLQPLVVRPVIQGFEVIAGNRRLEACKKLRISKVSCHILELDDKEAYEVALVENVQHQTLGVLEEAEAFRKYVDEYGYGGVSDLGRKIGKSQEYVSQRLRLLSLPKEVLDQVIRRLITPSHALELVGLPKQDQIELAGLASDHDLPSADVRTIVKRIKALTDVGGKSAARGSDSPELYSSMAQREREIDRILGHCIASLKICLVRLDDAVGKLSDDDWVIREWLMQNRWLAHQQIDNIIRLRKRFHRVQNVVLTTGENSKRNTKPSR